MRTLSEDLKKQLNLNLFVYSFIVNNCFDEEEKHHGTHECNNLGDS